MNPAMVMLAALMLSALLQLPIILPVLFWAIYHYHKDRHLPGPVSHLSLAFMLGIGSFYIGLFLYWMLGLVNLRYDAFLLAETNPAGLFVYAIGVIGVVEDLVKTILAALAFTALLHGIYGFVVIALPAPALPVAALLITAIWLWRLRLIRDLHNAMPGPCPQEQD
jgi:hypothetical protein